MVNFQPGGQMRKMFIQSVTEAHRKKKSETRYQWALAHFDVLVLAVCRMFVT